MTNAKSATERLLLLILLAVDLSWLQSSYSKISSGNFVSTLGATLSKFASNNPYPPVKSFLLSVAIPNFTLFGTLTMWGELFTGLAVLLSVVYLFFGASKLVALLLTMGLIGGMFLNAVFYFAAGWISSSTASVNQVMFLVQAVGLIFAVKLLFRPS